MSRVICFWTAANGNHYTSIAKGMLRSYRQQQISFDFHVFSNIAVPGCINHVISPFHHPSYFYKIDLLDLLSASSRYSHYVWVDADSYFMRPIPEEFITLMVNNPTFGFMCEGLTDAALNGMRWHGLTSLDLRRIAAHYRLGAIRYTNSGLFAVRADTVSRFVDTCHRIEETILSICGPSSSSDERSIAIAHQLISRGLPLLYDCPTWYAVDHFGLPWEGEMYGMTYGLGYRLPRGPWIARSWSHHFKYAVDPAIAHVMKSKAALRAYGDSP